MLTLKRKLMVMVMCVRANRAGDWELYLYTYKEMIPYLLCCWGLYNYARYEYIIFAPWKNYPRLYQILV